MFVKPFYAEKNGNIYYYVVDASQGDGPTADMMFYINQNKVDQATGSTGEFILKGADAELIINNKLLKSTQTLKVDGVEVPMDKIKKKELRNKLAAKGYYNDFNPSKKDIESQKLKLQNFILPMILMSIASVVYFFVRDSAHFWMPIIGFAGLFIASLSFASVLGTRFKWMSIGKVPLLVAFAFMMGMIGILDTLNYGTWKVSDLKSELGTDKSVQLRVPVYETDYQGTTYIKSRRIDPFHLQYYEFTINGKRYEGRYKSPTPEYAVGDSIDIYYLISDPRINQSVK